MHASSLACKGSCILPLQLCRIKQECQIGETIYCRLRHCCCFGSTLCVGRSWSVFSTVMSKIGMMRSQQCTVTYHCSCCVPGSRRHRGLKSSLNTLIRRESTLDLFCARPTARWNCTSPNTTLWPPCCFSLVGPGKKRQEFCQGSEKSAKTLCYGGLRCRQWRSYRHTGAPGGEHQCRLSLTGSGAR